MPESPKSNKKPFTPDWLVQGILTKLGDTFDRILGRGWKPSSNLATSELIERLKALLDAEARGEKEHGLFVPHNIKLKMQWDKFSTDSDEALKKVENELLIATIDHINDKRYYTYGPISLEVRPDYFTNGVRLFVSFDDGSDDEGEAQIHVPTSAVSAEIADTSVVATDSVTVIACFRLAGEAVQKTLELEPGKRLGLGRTKENDLAINDISVSKIHASLMLNREGDLIVADTGSTNGTFVNGERIPYGKAITIKPADRLEFGEIEVQLEFLPKHEMPEEVVEIPKSETYTVGDFEFTKRLETGATEDDDQNEPKPQVANTGVTAGDPPT
jgi:hypothetical protein